MGPEEGAKLLTGRSAEEIAKLLQELPSDDAAAIIDHLPKELSAAVLELIQKRPAGVDVGELLEYPEQTAGRIMNPKVFALSEDMTAGEAITTLQGARDVEMVFYLYVIDARRHLVGVISLRRLLLSSLRGSAVFRQIPRGIRSCTAAPRTLPPKSQCPCRATYARCKRSRGCCRWWCSAQRGTVRR